MRRRFLLLVALAGVIWLYLRRGGRRPQSVVQIPPSTDPAEELRRKLEETKERTDEPVSHLATPEPEGAAEPLDASAPAGTEDLDAKRREVHDRARSAADEMRRSTTD
jgi:hypothetical protein